MTAEELADIQGRCVVDAGRGDLIYCMGEAERNENSNDTQE